MLNRKQIAVITFVVLLMTVLLSLDIKGLVKPKDQQGEKNSSHQEAEDVSLSIQEVSATAKQQLNANLAQQISELENVLKSSSGQEKVMIQKQLSQKWDDVNQPDASALYLEEVSKQENTYSNWLKTGDLLTEGYQATEDTLIKPVLIQKAIFAYKNADKVTPNTPEVKTGLGIAYVTGTANPMQGIQLLLDVVKQDPENVKANMNLGLFSMKSGQYQKAVDRFKKVIQKKPDAEAWFYLASAYENMRMNDEAIKAYSKSKEMAGDVALGQFVDRKIQELKSN